MTGMGISRLTVKKILNHAERDVTAVYDRHSYDPEKRTRAGGLGPPAGRDRQRTGLQGSGCDDGRSTAAEA